MFGMSQTALISAGIVVATLALAAWIGRRRRRAELAAHVEELVGAARSNDRVRPGAEELERLPAPVARYLEWALPGNPRIRVAQLQQTGVLRTDARRERWMPFVAEHIAAPGATGFVWNARVNVAPLLHVRVRDAFIAGKGSGEVSFLSAFTVASDSGTPEMDSGALHRYLAEAVWYPTALLPSAKLRWDAVDDRRAVATLTEAGVTVSLEFRFADTGEVKGIYTPARWGRFGGGYEQVPWEGRFRAYEECQGMRIPAEGEVGWYFEYDWRGVWKGRITSARYELANGPTG